MKLIPDGNLMSAEPVLPVRWCLERSETQQLKIWRAKNIKILIVIAYEGTNLEDRQLVPIDQMIAYLNFRRPGMHTVLARVVYGEEMSRLLQKVNSRQYDTNLLTEDRGSFRASLPVESLTTSDVELDVFIPREHFPAEPGPVQKWLGNLGYNYPAIDQCELRRRILYSPIKIFSMGLWGVITTVIRACIALFYSLFLARDINFKAVIHPWSADIEDVGRRAWLGNTWFTGKKIYWYLCHPLIPLALLSASGFTAHKVHMSFGHVLEIFIISILITVIFLAIVISLIIFLIMGKDKTQELFREYLSKRKERIEKEKLRIPAEETYDELYKLLACRRDNTPALSNIPVEHRTLRLRFLNLKRKVCRPFAAS